MFWAEIWKVFFLSENFQFLVKFSIYLNRRVFVMRNSQWNMSHLTTKPTKCVCLLRRLRSARASENVNNSSMGTYGSKLSSCHYENTPTENFTTYWKTRLLRILPPKNENFQMKNSGNFHISAQNIDCGYSLEPPHRGGSNEYPKSMFWASPRRF